MARSLRALGHLVAATAVVVGGLQILAPDAAHAATAVTINGAAGCAGTTYCFAPATVTVPSGDTVTWTNQSGGPPHTVTRCDPAACNGTDGGTGTDPTFDQSVGANNGSTASQVFNGAGTYNYYCKIHGFAVMHGTVTVQGQAAPTTTTTGASTPTTSAPATTTTTAAPSTTPGTVAATTPTPAAAPAQAVAGQVNFTG